MAVLQACAEDIEKANMLMVEAGKLVQAADAAPLADEKLKLLDQASDMLNQIVERYPSTEIAAKLAAGDSIGDLSLNKLQDTRIKVCRTFPALSDFSCFTEYVITTAQKLAEDSFYFTTNYIDGLARIAKAQAGVGNVQKAQDILAKALATAESDFSRDDYGLSIIAVAQAEAGNFQEALSIADRIQKSSYRASALASIAGAQAEAGNVDEALIIAEKIRNNPSRADALASIAGAQVEAGNVQDAFVTAKKTFDHAGRAKVLARIAEIQEKAGDLQDAQETLDLALTTAEKIENDFHRADVLVLIIGMQAKADNVQKAFEIAQKMENNIYRIDALAQIAAALVLNR